MKRRSTSTLTLPKKEKGVYILTPKTAKETGTALTDLERLVRDLSKDLGVDLWMTTTVVNTGFKLEWGPASDISNTKEVGAFGEAPNIETLDDDLHEYLDRKYDELNEDGKGEAGWNL